MRLKALIDVSSESLEGAEASCEFGTEKSSASVLTCFEILSPSKSRMRFLLAPSNHTLHSELEDGQSRTILIERDTEA